MCQAKELEIKVRQEVSWANHMFRSHVSARYLCSYSCFCRSQWPFNYLHCPDSVAVSISVAVSVAVSGPCLVLQLGNFVALGQAGGHVD